MNYIKIGISKATQMKKNKLFLNKILSKIIDGLSALRKRLDEEQIDIKSNLYDDLSPSYLSDKDFEEYDKAIKWALNNTNIKNLAISGPYGSGKSSIIKTFKNKHKEYEYLSISLAAFNDEKLPEDRIIERSILEQIFYRVKYKKIPSSRFKRIVNIKRKEMLLRVILLLGWLCSAIFVFYPSLYKSINLGGDPKILELIWLNYLFFAVFLIGLYFVISPVIRILNKVKLNKFSIKGGEIEFNENSNASILNYHFDEILYFFESNPFNVVVFEDLDRFNKSEIFTKLREMNILLNNSEDIKDKNGITFIYAIKDNMFEKNTSRTKFFDFIIPIIPVINSSNSFGKILDKVSKYELSEELSRDFLSDISLYIDDMRVLKNIFNEFILYKNILESKELDYNRLLAIIIYKNIYPLDFSLLHDNKGLIYTAFDSINKVKSFLSKDLLKRTFEIENEIKEINNELIYSTNELRAIYVEKLIEMLPNGAIGIVNSKGNKILFKDLKNDTNFRDFISSTKRNYIEHNNREAYSALKFHEIEDQVNEKIGYLDREAILNKKMNGYIERLNIELQQVKEEIRKNDSLNLNEALDRVVDSNLIGKVVEEDLLMYFIRYGYIDEMYPSYISHFYEGNLSKKDREFVFSIKNRKKLNFNHEIGNIRSILEKIRLTEFSQDEILNITLIEYLIKNKGKYPEHLKAFFHQLKQAETVSLEFIEEYLNHEEREIIDFLELLGLHFINFWDLVLDNETYTEDKKDLYFNFIISFMTIEGIKNQNSNQNIYKYLSNDKYHLTKLNGPRYQDRLKIVIKELDIKFTQLDTLNVNDDILDYVYNNNLYAINIGMVESMFKKYRPNSIVDHALLNEANLSTIRNSKCEKLIEYINANILEYVNEVFLKLETNDKESNEVIVDLLNNFDIPFEIREKIILKQVDLEIDTIDQVPNEIWSIIFEEIKIKIDWYNVILYFNFDPTGELEYGEKILDETLINFLNNKEVFTKLSKSKLIKVDFDVISQEVFDVVGERIILSEKITLEAYTELIKSITKEFDDLDFSKLSKEKIHALIYTENLDFNITNYELMRSHFDNEHLHFLIKNFDTYLGSYDSFTLESEDEYYRLLGSSDLTPSQKVQIIEKFDSNILKEKSDLADLIMVIIVNYPLNFSISSDLVTNLCKTGKSKAKKIKLVNILDINNERITELLSLIGYPYRNLTVKGRRPILTGKEWNKKLVEKLLKNGYISSFKEENGDLRVNTKRK